MPMAAFIQFLPGRNTFVNGAYSSSPFSDSYSELVALASSVCVSCRGFVYALDFGTCAFTRRTHLQRVCFGVTCPNTYAHTFMRVVNVCACVRVCV